MSVKISMEKMLMNIEVNEGNDRVAWEIMKMGIEKRDKVNETRPKFT